MHGFKVGLKKKPVNFSRPPVVLSKIKLVKFPATSCFALAAVLLVPAAALGQITYGLQQNVIPWQEGLYLAGYDVLSDTWVWADTLEYAEAFGLGSSTYNHAEDNYVFLGVPSGSLGGLQWMEHPVDGEAPPFATSFEGTLHSIHHDMQADVFYGLQGYGLDSTWVDWGDGNGYWEINNWATRVVSIDPAPGTAVLTSVLELPWLEGVVAGASCFDSDTHRFFIWGIDNQGSGRLVAVDCEAQSVVSDVQPDLLSNQNLSELEFNIVDGQLLGLLASLDGNGGADMELVSVDPNTGEMTSELALPQVNSYTPDGTVFDQLNRIYILHYYQGTGISPRILSVDAGSMELMTDVALDANFLELEMSNALFASQRYATAAVHVPDSNSLVCLMHGFWVNAADCPMEVTMHDVSGRRVLERKLEAGESLEVPQGFGLWEFRSGRQIDVKKTFRR